MTGREAAMDWIASCLTLLTVELTARKLWYGWLVGLVSQGAYITLALQNELYGLLPLSTYLMVRYALAARTWYRK